MGSNIERIRERAPLRLTVNVETPDKRHYRWSEDDPNPANSPSGLEFSSVMPGGHERLNCALERDPRVAYRDLAPLSNVTVLGVGGRVAWQGRLEKTPDTGGFQAQVSPEAVGWQANLEDDSTAREIYRDGDLTKWGPASVGRKLEIVNASENVVDPTVGGSGGPAATRALITAIQGPWTRLTVCEAWYSSGGIPISGLLYALQPREAGKVGDDVYTDEKWSVAASLSADEFLAAADSTGNLRAHLAAASFESSLFATTRTRIYAALQLYFNGAGGGEGVEYPIYWPTLATYGMHGLPTYGPEFGLLASDVVAHAIGKWATKLKFTTGSAGTIKPSSFVIAQLAFLAATNAAEILKQATRFELPDWAVWEGPTFYMNPRGERGNSWRARVGPAQLQQTGPQVARLWNGVVVSYTDPTGVPRTVGPPGSGSEQESALLHDADPENPLNIAGIPKPAPLSMGTTTPAGAEQVGSIFLRETKGLDTSGQASLVGHVEDEAGVLWPAWEVRAGDTVAFSDAADPSPRRVVHAGYDNTALACTVQLDQPPDSLTAILERLSASLGPLGLS
jgi:hypothetical protein